jgi:hypothetical protein
MAEYTSDVAAWAAEQAEALRTHNTNKLDWDNLAEEIDGVAISQRKEIRSRLKVLCLHLLKWQYQPELRGGSWRSTIDTQREEISDTLEDSPSLHPYPATVLPRAYTAAQKKAKKETGVFHLPTECPWTIEQVLDPDFLP